MTIFYANFITNIDTRYYILYLLKILKNPFQEVFSLTLPYYTCCNIGEN